MKLQTLYSRRGDGNLQEWTVEIEGSKYRVLSGRTDGKKAISKWRECQGKNIGRSNETTPEEQAMSEAQAKWQKKIDKGYTKSPDSVDSITVFKPTLAYKYKDHSKKLFKDDRKVYSDPKLNGMRCIARANGLWTRTGKPIVSCPHIFEALKPLFDKYPKLILDGELYNHELRHKLNHIMSLVKRDKLDKEKLQNSKDNVEYHIFDGINIEGLGPEQLFSKRKPAITKAIEELGQTFLKVVKSVEVSSHEEIDKEYRYLLSEDWEGQIIRVDGPYENKRTNNLLKRKEFQDEEYEIVDIQEGKGNWAGAAKAVVCKHPSGGTFRSNIRGNYKNLEKILRDRDSLIGKTATVKFFEKTEFGIPQFPFVVMIDRESFE